MCMIDDGERCTIYRTKMQRSRKSRQCDECGRAIAVGDTYKYAFGAFEGRGTTYEMCEHCSVAAQWLQDNCGGFLHFAVWEDYEEHIREYPRLAFSLSRLSVARRRKWERFDRSGLMAVPPVPPSFAEVGLGA